MGSSFLTTINALLALYSLIVFVKFIIQFGLPNHPARFTLYVVTLCATSYFSMKAPAGLGVVSPIDYLRWRTLPLIGGGLGLLLQVLTTIGKFTFFQQKVISRVPLMASIVVFALFPDKSDVFFGLCILAAVLFLTISVGKVRYQKRMFVKMVLFLMISAALKLTNNFWAYVLGELFLFPVLFYFFIFQQALGVTALVESRTTED